MREYIKEFPVETVMDNIIHWSEMTTLIDERLSELNKGSEMYEQLVRAREQYCELIANAV